MTYISATTLSAFGFETIDLVRRGQTLTAFGNISVNILRFLLAVQVGFLILPTVVCREAFDLTNSCVKRSSRELMG